MKRLISIILAVLLLFALTIPAMALPLEAGAQLQRIQFKKGYGPEPEDDPTGHAIDYSYYSPVKDENDETKYPLVIFLAGLGEGDHKGEVAYDSSELTDNNFALWACDEYQEKFVGSKGAFLLLARAPEEEFLTWSSMYLVSGLKAAIDDFCETNPNVDTERIYAIGWCLGAIGVLNFEVTYPGSFAMTVIMVPDKKLTEDQAKALANSNVWLMGSKFDSLSLYNRYITPSWDLLKKYQNEGTRRYFTSYTSAKSGGLILSHNVWDDACYNWTDYPDKAVYVKKTIDETGSELKISSFIETLSSVGAEKYEEEYTSFLAKFRSLFQSLIEVFKNMVDRIKNVFPISA